MNVRVVYILSRIVVLPGTSAHFISQRQSSLLKIYRTILDVPTLTLHFYKKVRKHCETSKRHERKDTKQQ